MMAGIKPPFTVANAIYYGGVTDSASFNGDTKADRMDNEIFDEEFSSCKDKIYE